MSQTFCYYEDVPIYFKVYLHRTDKNAIRQFFAKYFNIAILCSNKLTHFERAILANINSSRICLKYSQDRIFLITDCAIIMFNSEGKFEYKVTSNDANLNKCLVFPNSKLFANISYHIVGTSVKIHSLPNCLILQDIHDDYCDVAEFNLIPGTYILRIYYKTSDYGRFKIKDYDFSHFYYKFQISAFLTGIANKKPNSISKFSNNALYDSHLMSQITQFLPNNKILKKNYGILYKY